MFPAMYSQLRECLTLRTVFDIPDLGESIVANCSVKTAITLTCRVQSLPSCNILERCQDPVRDSDFPIRTPGNPSGIPMFLSYAPVLQLTDSTYAHLLVIDSP